MSSLTGFPSHVGRVFRNNTLPTAVAPTPIMPGAVTVAVLALALVPVFSLEAQATRTTTRVQVSRPALTGACAAFTSGPSALADSPEGLAILRFKRELEGIATVIEQHGATVNVMDARRMIEMQRGVDSLMQVFVRYRTADGSLGNTITLRRSDSAMVVNGRLLDSPALFATFDSTMRRARPEIEVQLRAIGPQVAALASAGARVVNKASQAGYMGVNLSGSQIRIVSDSGSFTAHCDYPMIEAVDVGSPARRAGLAAGDTITAYNGRDVVAQAVNYPQLLVPGKVVRVKVRRDGRMRDVAVTVSERPAALAENVVRMTAVPFGTVTPGRPLAPRSGVMTRAPVATSGSAMGFAVGNGGMLTMLGAQFNAVDDDFAQTLGIEPGLLVMRVQAGSPAAESGLRAGEVIRAVNGVPLRDLTLLQRMTGQSGVREVRLTVSTRDAAPRVVLLKW